MTIDRKHFTLKEIGEIIPSGGKIVGIVQHNGFVVLATEHHVFRGSFEAGDFEQLLFYMLEEATSPSAAE